MITFHLIGLFDKAVKAYLSESILGRAKNARRLKLIFYDLRQFTERKKDWGKRVDDRPYGGGPGMVLRAEPVLSAFLAAKKATGLKSGRRVKTIILSPRGKMFTNKVARQWARKYSQIILIAGHYEGIDERVKRIARAEAVSIGPYILTGGELPALIIVDALTRQLPGVLGKEESLEENRTAGAPVFTRPADLVFNRRTYRVPKVLLSGNHKLIEKWRSDHIPKRY